MISNLKSSGVADAGRDFSRARGARPRSRVIGPAIVVLFRAHAAPKQFPAGVSLSAVSSFRLPPKGGGKTA